MRPPCIPNPAMLPPEPSPTAQPLSEGAPHAKGSHCGPIVKYANVQPGSKEWRGSVLFLTRTDQGGSEPELHYERERNADTQVAPTLLDTVGAWRFWRFEVSLLLEEAQRKVHYAVRWEAQNFKSAFWVPAVGQAFHWAYTSCNGMSSGTFVQIITFGLSGHCLYVSCILCSAHRELIL
jgi:hypothetical protein